MRSNLAEQEQLASAPANENGATLTLTAVQAYRADVADWFCDAVARKLDLPAEVRERMQLALHEVVANAVIHGCLEVDGFDRDSVTGFADYCQRVEERLEQPEFASRNIEIAGRWDPNGIVVKVRDFGPGYDVAAKNDGNSALHRGLGLIRTLADTLEIGDEGRLVTMQFGL